MALAFHALPLAGTILLLASRRVSLLGAGSAGMLLAMATLAAVQPDAGTAVAVVARKAAEGVWLAWHAMSIIAAGLLFHRAYEARPVAAEAAAGVEDRRRTAVTACFLVGPFAESVTGFGIGLVVALAMLRPLDLPPVRAAALGLFSQILVPWGAMGVGTRVGAELVGVTFADLGSTSALLMLVVLPGVLPVFWWLIHRSGIASRPADRLRDLLLVLALGGLIWVTNRWVAPELGGGLSTGLLLLLLEGPRRLRDPAALPRLAGRLWPYALLVGGLMATRLLPPLSGWTASWLVLDPFDGLAPLPVLRHPSSWLVLLAMALLVRLPPGAAGGVVTGALRAALMPMATTLVFIVLAVCMAASGGAALFGAAWRELAGPFAVLATPLFGAAVGMLTGSNTAGNALMMTIQLNLAAGSGVPPLLVAALQAVSGSLWTMLNPGRIVMAASLLGLARAEGAVYRASLPIGVAAVLVLLAVVAVACFAA